jgi:galactose mutarotase-like enzyme
MIDGAYYSGATERLEVDGTLLLRDDLFAKDAIVFRQPAFRRVSLCEKGGEKLLDFVCPEWDAVGFWTKPGAPFFCIEPWWGWADSWADNGDLTDKPGLHSLMPGEVGSHRYGFGFID